MENKLSGFLYDDIEQDEKTEEIPLDSVRKDGNVRLLINEQQEDQKDQKDRGIKRKRVSESPMDFFRWFDPMGNVLRKYGW